MEYGTTFDQYIDWRNNNGNFVTSIKNQSPFGACIAFSAIAVIESMILIENKNITNIDLSEADVFGCGLHSPSLSDQGFLPWVDLKFRGVVPETYFTWNEYVSSPSCKDIENRNELAWQFTDSHILQEVNQQKWYLTNIGPLSVVPYASSHGVTIVGFDEENEMWIVKNSWGERGSFEWMGTDINGRKIQEINGFLYIPYGQSGSWHIDGETMIGLTGIKKLDNSSVIKVRLKDQSFLYETFGEKLLKIDYNTSRADFFVYSQNDWSVSYEGSWINGFGYQNISLENTNYRHAYFTLDWNTTKCPRTVKVNLIQNNNAIYSFNLIQSRKNKE